MAAYRVLVVDDNHEIRRMVTASLKTLGTEIDVLDVPSAEEALVISATVPLDLVVLDFRLPGMTGLDLVSRLRARRPQAKIILVTGVEDPATRQQIAEAHTEAYFFKPIEIDKFLDAVKACLWTDHQPAPVPENAASLPADLTPAPQPELVTPPAPVETGQSLPPHLMPNLDERLTTLKQQLRAVSVLLVTDAGQVVEVAGNPSQMTSGSALLAALMNAFRASVQVSQAISGGNSTSLQYFAAQKQCLYVVPVGLNHALFVITSNYFEPEKLGTVDRYFQLAVRDLQAILANIAAEEQARQAQLEKLHNELPAQVTVDPETRQLVDEMFTQVVAKGEDADEFWDALAGGDAPGKLHEKDVLTFDQARNLGLAPGEDKKTGPSSPA